MADRHPVWFERAVPPELLAEVEAEVVVLGPANSAQPWAGLAAARGAVVGVSRFDEETIDRAPDLRVIARTGIGVDRVDISAATRRGIAVCNAPDAPTVSTAEHALALMLAVAKNLKAGEAGLRSGQEDRYARHHAIELEGTVLGLVGYGRIARRVAEAACALGMQVTAFDPNLPADAFDGTGRSASLSELLASADVVSLHLPLTPETAGSFGPAQFAAMKPGAVFVNTARGGLVDHDALLEALESGRLVGAGLDVTDPEPLDPDHPLLRRLDVVVTPHVASATVAGRIRLLRTAFRQVVMVLDGRRPPHLVNPAVWDRLVTRS